MAKKSAIDTAATQALSSANRAFVVHHYELDPESTSQGSEASGGLGVKPERVFRTYIVEADEQDVVVVVPVNGILDFDAIASTVGAGSAQLASAKKAFRVSGYELDGVSPIATKKELPVIVDLTTTDFKTVFISAGTRGFELEVSPQDLIEITNARTAPITRFFN